MQSLSHATNAKPLNIVLTNSPLPFFSLRRLEWCIWLYRHKEEPNWNLEGGKMVNGKD